MYSAQNYGDGRDLWVDISVAPVEVSPETFSLTPLLILGGILLILKNL